MQALIPDKLFFKIGEVAGLLAVRPSVLRYWETEFESLSPGKSRSGQRLYTRKEVELAFEIKQLLYSEKITIEGARRRINSRAKKGIMEVDNVRLVLNEIRTEIAIIRDSLVRESTSVKNGA